MSSPLSPQFYLIRPESKQTPTSGKVTYSIVPLIPADQLPEWLEIVGVPRTLHHQQASRMSSVGIVPRDVGFYDVQFMGSDVTHPLPPSFSWAEATPSAPVPVMSEAEEDPLSSSSIHPPDDENDPWPSPVSGVIPSAEEPSVQDQGEDNMTTDYSPPPSPSIHTDAKGFHDTVPTQSASSTPLPDFRGEGNHHDSSADYILDQVPSPPPEQQQHQKGKKQPSRSFCHHWCSHGVCKWGPRCRFLHEMPETPEGLTSVGLTGYPRWYIGMMRKMDFSNGPDHAKKLVYMKANSAPQHCRARHKGNSAYPQDGSSNAVPTPTEIKQTHVPAVSTKKTMKNYRQQEVGKTRPGVGLGGEGGKNGGSMMEQLTRSLSGIDLGGSTTANRQAAVPSLSSGRLAKPEKSPLYQRRPPIRTRGPRDHILIAAIGDGEPIDLRGGKARVETDVKQVGDNNVPALQAGKGGQEKVANSMGNEKRMDKFEWKRELEQRGKEKAPEKAPEKGVAKEDLGSVDLLTFSDSE